jgi:hypothetical protein
VVVEALAARLAREQGHLVELQNLNHVLEPRLQRQPGA